MNRKNIPWDSYSAVIIAIYSMLLVIRWPILPQFMDIYYHFLTAWGFNQAGGYSGWDFWQYAPFGRVHIYPPLFHIFLAFIMKMGISVTILAKLCETAVPIILIITLWFFVKNNFGERLCFFVILALSSSFSFYMSLLNHIPATIALIFGLLSIGQLLKSSFLSSLIFLVLSFYAHIGIPWFFLIAILIYAFLNKEHSSISFKVAIGAMILSAPLFFKQICGFRFISAFGFEMNEKNAIQIKMLDYILAIAGLIFIFSKEKKYRIFAAMFLASFIFLSYPYRFFSGEGYLPVIFLAGFFVDFVYERLKSTKYPEVFLIAIALFMLVLSPSITKYAAKEDKSVGYRINIFDSVLDGMLFARGRTIWFPNEYMAASKIIKDNSKAGDIIYSPLNLVGVILSAVSGRATANALLPEIGPSVQFDPYVTSKIIIFNRLDDKNLIESLINKFRLEEIGETKTFILYTNNSCTAKVNKRSASVPFSLIIGGGIILSLLYIRPLYSVSKKYLT